METSLLSGCRRILGKKAENRVGGGVGGDGVVGGLGARGGGAGGNRPV